MGRRMRGDETYNLKLKYGISIDITYCSHRLFEKKKESLTLSRCLPPSSGFTSSKFFGSRLKSD
jgi:hypothetical protein